MCAKHLVADDLNPPPSPAPPPIKKNGPVWTHKGQVKYCYSRSALYIEV